MLKKYAIDKILHENEGCIVYRAKRLADNFSVIIKSIIYLAKTMKFDVIAEGVEIKAQQDYLVSKGCRLIQGYFNAKPMPASEMEAYIQSHT
jgi:sensor c-di-GMP phosphodiesterase-like protein